MRKPDLGGKFKHCMFKKAGLVRILSAKTADLRKRFETGLRQQVLYGSNRHMSGNFPGFYKN